MANAKEIQARMKSIQDTMKITNAMYMISSSKMKRAKQVLADTEPYFYNMQNAVSRILRHMPDVDHVFFDTRPHIEIQDRKIGCIVVTADKGLAGAYNHNVIKMTEEMVQEEGHHKLYVLGIVGQQYFRKKDVDMDEQFHYTVQKPTMHREGDSQRSCGEVSGGRSGRGGHHLYRDGECRDHGNKAGAASPVKKGGFHTAGSGRRAAGDHSYDSINERGSGSGHTELHYRKYIRMSGRILCQ